MTQADKELLLKDLCARLPYGVFVETTWTQQLTDVSGTIGTLRAGQIELFEDGDYSEIKPYLRPMLSMTDEEQNEFDYLRFRHDEEGWLDFVLSRHLDWRGLIEKGLALEAHEGMYE